MTYAGRAYGVVCRAPMQGTTPHRKKGQNMAERQETRQEQQTRWDAQRAVRDKDFQTGQHARRRRNARTWLIVAVIIIIIVVIVTVVLR